MNYDEENDMDGEWDDGEGGDGDDYGDDYDDDYYGDDHQDNFADIERAGAGNEYTGCWETGKGGEKLKIQTPLGRFCIKVDAISRNIESECKLLVQSDIGILQTFSQKVPRVQYKNPTAFVLGYIATKGGNKNIDEKSLKVVYDCYNKTESIDKDDSVKKPDVIRYARLWNILIKQ